MKRKGNLLLLGCLLTVLVQAQLGPDKKTFTSDDTLRGSLNVNRNWWNVTSYNLKVTPDIAAKSIAGANTIRFAIDQSSTNRIMQIDLQQPMQVDSIQTRQVAKAPASGLTTIHFSFKQQNNIYLVDLRDLATDSITIFYHGVPKAAKRAPWDGGLVWSTDGFGYPFVATACQGLGASVWWPCKDHQADEPDLGMQISITAPDTLTAVSNGRLVNVSRAAGNTKTWVWAVKNPINTYGVTMNIGNYVNWTDTLMGEGGKLDLSYWALQANLEKAKAQFSQAKAMLHCFEYWFGKYPFYEDSYKLVETPFLGMEHQSAVAYGNGYRNGYLGRDLSGSGWGLKWDFIIIHESGHEWFGNNITTKDIADMWVHEGFTNYSETLYTEWMFGKEAATDYVLGIRKNIQNDKNIIGIYGVNEEGSGDMYYKAANMINIIRRVTNNDTIFRQLLRNLNSSFFHKTVLTNEVEQLISRQTGINFEKTFDQYLRTTQVPRLEYYPGQKNTIFYRWANCVPGFNLPLVLGSGSDVTRIFPVEKWKSIKLKPGQSDDFLPAAIERLYYIDVQQVKGKP
ncbi:M1 family peptidase [Segetibacter sp. 3557_3]|uniref:M1 family metallopeptidase n=1 Tax=Segetibacter sp. 3557_3 TaxID=2547429 RepID=UPI0010588A6D|nr:M1 family metallopeptidase [Segetibacter sp. 3557_3]TDH26879.1 M1 family peptidase [Segetibacter sp. 3557_3]